MLPKALGIPATVPWCKFSPAGMGDSFVQRGGWWVVGQFLLMLVVAVLAITDHTVSRSFSIFVGGLVLFAASAVCGLAGLLVLGRNLTPFPKPTATARLVRRGIYSLIRHPLYTSVFCAAVGWSLVWQSWPALIASLAMGIFLDAKARHEERWLRQHFSEYAAYARQVRRFIPWIY